MAALSTWSTVHRQLGPALAVLAGTTLVPDEAVLPGLVTVVSTAPPLVSPWTTTGEVSATARPAEADEVTTAAAAVDASRTLMVSMTSAGGSEMSLATRRRHPGASLSRRGCARLLWSASRQSRHP